MQLSSISLAITRLGWMWNPSQLFASSEKGLWYDPSDFSTLFQDSAGTTPVTAVEQPVGKILDKSGRGFHATQATSTKRPILQQDASGRYYLLFDGVDDALATSSIDFTGTDKMSVFAGVRKLSDTINIVAELSGSINTNSGTFHLVSGSNGGFIWGSGARGTAGIAANQLAGATTPTGIDTATLAITHDIFGDISVLRRNTIRRTDAVGDKGAGNFGNYQLFIGSRAGTSLPFNGNLYSLIVRGSLSSDSQIAAAESYVNSKTGAY